MSLFQIYFFYHDDCRCFVLIQSQPIDLCVWVFSNKIVTLYLRRMTLNPCPKAVMLFSPLGRSLTVIGISIDGKRHFYNPKIWRRVEWKKGNFEWPGRKWSWSLWNEFMGAFNIIIQLSLSKAFDSHGKNTQTHTQTDTSIIIEFLFANKFAIKFL